MKNKLYYVALYLRLSRDDEDIDGSIKSESNSISSQREMLRSYVKEQDDMELFDIYVDDGYSGANFDRPEFKRMMADIEAGNVNCVIVKDLSRLGRDYIEAGRLIQKTFPAFQVRFIALTDNFDSLTADHNTKSLVLPIKNFINDSYCRDISQKVRSQQKIKREQGKYIGAFPVYGYRRSDEDKYKLCPDEYPAGIVKMIFAWKIEGMSHQAIANHLNELGVLSPLEYKKAHGERYSTGFRSANVAKWSSVAIKRILSNEVYVGNLVQGKGGRINYKLKKCVPKPEDEWVRVEGTHEAIVSREDFELVQKLLQIETRAITGEECAHLFSGILFCGDCEAPMVRRIIRYKDSLQVFFICGTKNKGNGCSRHSVSEAELKEVVLQTIRTQVALFLDVSSQLPDISSVEMDFEKIEKLDKEIERLQAEHNKYIELCAGLHEDLKTGLITEADFRNFRAVYEKKQEESEKALQKQRTMTRELFRKGVVSGVKLERFKEALQITDLDRDTLVTFVSRIEVFENKKICVEFRWKQELEKLLVLQKYIGTKE